MTQDAGTVVVGGGHAGFQLAVSAREAGLDGPITVLSAESPTGYQRPPLSKEFLKSPEAAPPSALRPQKTLDRYNITLRDGTAVEAIDRKAQRLALAGGESLPYDRLALAPGGLPGVPDVPGVDQAGVATLRSLADAQALRERLHAARRIAIVGGGFIGLEVAAVARSLGKQVAILEAGPHLLGRIAHPSLAHFYFDRHTDWGSEVWLESPLGAIHSQGGQVSEVETAGGERLPADMVLLAAGIRPATGLAESAGLSCDDGVLVDDTMATDDPQIVAAGDVTRFPCWLTGRRERLESVQNATDQARTAAKTLAGKPEPYRAVPWFWSDQGDLKLQIAGLSVGTTRTIDRGDWSQGQFSMLHYAGDRLMAVTSLNSPRDHMAARKLIG